MHDGKQQLSKSIPSSGFSFVLPELLEISLDILEASCSGEAPDEDLLCAHHHLWISLAWNCDLRLDDLSIQLMYREA